MHVVMIKTMSLGIKMLHKHSFANDGLLCFHTM